MAAVEERTNPKPSSPLQPLLFPPPSSPLLSSYLGLSFAVFLGLLPRTALSHLSTLHARNRALSLQLLHAEEQLHQMRSRRKEDSKANARVVEIFASHRNGWQQEEKRLLHQIDASAEEISGLRDRIVELERSESELRACVEKLQREVAERDEMIDFMSRKVEVEVDGEYFVDKEEEKAGKVGGGFETFDTNFVENGAFGDYGSDFSKFGRIRIPEGFAPVPEVCYLERKGEAEEMAVLYGQHNGFNRNFISSPSKAWTDRSNDWKDTQYESLESLYPMKHFVSRRESPWKVNGESTGISSKLKLLEQELVNLEKVGNGELSKVPSLMRKQAKRYQSLSGKIDELCRRMQISDPSEPTLSPEFRTQRQTDFLLETFRLHQRSVETRQKLTALQTETTKSSSCMGDEAVGKAKVSTRKSLDSIRNNFKEIQRNLEIWLARIMGDLEGILARDGASSRLRDYYVSSGYPFVR